MLGFVGSPWTLATYIIEGSSSGLYKTIKTMIHGNPDLLSALLAHLAEQIATYSCYQIQSGAQCIQLFDSWGGQLPPQVRITYTPTCCCLKKTKKRCMLVKDMWAFLTYDGCAAAVSTAVVASTHLVRPYDHSRGLAANPPVKTDDKSIDLQALYSLKLSTVAGHLAQAVSHHVAASSKAIRNVAFIVACYLSLTLTPASSNITGHSLSIIHRTGYPCGELKFMQCVDSADLGPVVQALH